MSVLRLIGFQFERNKDSLKGLAPKEAFKRVPKLQSQLNALLNCKMRQHHIGRNALIISTYMLLLKDSLVLYPMLNVGVIGLIDQCFKMKKKEAQRVLDIYTLFVKETEALINLYDISKTFTARLPPIHPAKSTLIDVLTQHISKLEDDGEGDMFTEEMDMNDIEGERDDSHYTTDTHHEKHAEDDSDTSSESSDDEASTGPSGGFDFGFGAPTAGNNGARSGSGTTVVNNRASVGPNSWGALTSQPQQPFAVTAQGWNIFDSPNSSSSSPAPASGGFQVTFGANDPNDPFAAFNAIASPTPASPQPLDTIPYHDRAAAVKAGISQVYAQQPLQPQALPRNDNPFTAPTAHPSASNPFGDNPFATQTTPASPTNISSPPPTTTSPTASTGYNPFL